MPATHDLLTNIRLWSVQAGVIGGSLTGLVGTLQTVGVPIPAYVTVAAGALTALSVFVLRLLPQPSVIAATAPAEVVKAVAQTAGDAVVDKVTEVVQQQGDKLVKDVVKGLTKKAQK